MITEDGFGGRDTEYKSNASAAVCASGVSKLNVRAYAYGLDGSNSRVHQ